MRILFHICIVYNFGARFCTHAPASQDAELAFSDDESDGNHSEFDDEERLEQPATSEHPDLANFNSESSSSDNELALSLLEIHRSLDADKSTAEDTSVELDVASLLAGRFYDAAISSVEDKYSFDSTIVHLKNVVDVYLEVIALRHAATELHAATDDIATGITWGYISRLHAILQNVLVSPKDMGQFDWAYLHFKMAELHCYMLAIAPHTSVRANFSFAELCSQTAHWYALSVAEAREFESTHALPFEIAYNQAIFFDEILNDASSAVAFLEAALYKIPWQFGALRNDMNSLLHGMGDGWEILTYFFSKDVSCFHLE